MASHSKARNRATALAGALMATLLLAAALPAGAQQPKPPTGGVLVWRSDTNFQDSGYFYIVNNTRNPVAVKTDSDWPNSTGNDTTMIGPWHSLLQGMRQITLSHFRLSGKNLYPHLFVTTVVNGRTNGFDIKIQQIETVDGSGTKVEWIYWTLEEHSSDVPFTVSDSLVTFPSGACAYTYAYSTGGNLYTSSSAAIVSRDIAVSLIMQGGEKQTEPVVLMISEILDGEVTYQNCSSTAP